MLNFRKRGRRVTQWLDDEVTAHLAEDRLTYQSHLDERREALGECLGKLPAEARRLVTQHYHEDLTIQEIARQTGRSANVLYKAFERVRRWLADCVERTLAAGGEA